MAVSAAVTPPAAAFPESDLPGAHNSHFPPLCIQVSACPQFIYIQDGEYGDVGRIIDRLSEEIATVVQG